MANLSKVKFQSSPLSQANVPGVLKIDFTSIHLDVALLPANRRTFNITLRLKDDRCVRGHALLKTGEVFVQLSIAAGHD